MTESARHQQLLTTDDSAIVLICVRGESWYLYRGEEHLDQLLISDGEFPKPVKCLNFGSALEVTMVLGETVNVSTYWGIHPAIVTRLRETGDLIEIDG